MIKQYITRYKKTPWKNLKIGDVVWIKYPKSYASPPGKRIIHNKQPHILLINVKPYEGLVHSLILDNVLDSDLPRIYRVVKRYNKDSRILYEKLKKIIRKKDYYRTYYKIGIRAFSLAEVNWDKILK